MSPGIIFITSVCFTLFIFAVLYMNYKHNICNLALDKFKFQPIIMKYIKTLVVVRFYFDVIC